MRKKTLKIIAIVTCFAIVSLSVPTVANAKSKDSTEKFSFSVFMMKNIEFFEHILARLGITTDPDPAPTTDKVSKMNPETEIPTKFKKKITGTLNSVKPPKTGDDE